MSALWDAHSHLDHPDFDGDRAAVWRRAQQAGVRGTVIAGADPSRWDRVVEVAEELGQPWTLGLHPWWIEGLDVEGRRVVMETLAARATPHGIGETGLDFLRARGPEDRAAQVELTRAHLALAREREVPIVLHCVRAYPELVRLLRRDGVPTAGGLVHGWTGPCDLALQVVGLGLSVSFGPAVLRSAKAQAAARAVPGHALCVESDCPDQSVVRGRRGEPADVAVVATAVARVRGESWSAGWGERLARHWGLA